MQSVQSYLYHFVFYMYVYVKMLHTRICKIEIIKLRIFGWIRRLFLAASFPIPPSRACKFCPIAMCGVSVFYQINSRPIRRTIFAPRHRIKYFCIPSEAALLGKMLRQTDMAAKWPVVVSCGCFFLPPSLPELADFFCHVHGLTAADIFAYINSRFSRKTAFHGTLLSRDILFFFFFFSFFMYVTSDAFSAL